MSGPDVILAAVLGIPLACMIMAGFYVQWQAWQTYHRLGNYAIGLVTYFMQLQWPGVNFPGPNVLEAQIAAQPADFREFVQLVRRRMRYLTWAVVSYIGFFALALFLVRTLSS